jgi:hypothetical protein
VTVLDRCTSVRSQIQARNALKLAYKNAETFRERATELKELREGLDAAVARLDVLKARELLPRSVPSPAKATTVVARCQEGLAANPNEIGTDYGLLKRALGGLTKEVLGVVDKVLEAVQRDLPSVDEAFLKQVELVPGYQGKVVSIRQQRQAFLQGTDPKRSSEALAQFLDRRTELRSLADDLEPSQFPTEVLDFFKAGRQGQGAPLEKFTDGVKQWLNERGLLKNVRVTVIAK